MSAHSKLTRLGLGSVLVALAALATGLGGCAESMPASGAVAEAPFAEKNPIALTRFVPLRPHAESSVVPEVKTAALVTHGVAKRSSSVTGMSH